jgi:hypothetical protein
MNTGLILAISLLVAVAFFAPFILLVFSAAEKVFNKRNKKRISLTDVAVLGGICFFAYMLVTALVLGIPEMGL